MISSSEMLEIRCGAETRHYPLTKQVSTVGRLSNNDVVLNDSHTSREHARIERKGNALYITDLKSTNGTLLNNRKLEPHVPYQLRDGDVISIGSFALTPRFNQAISARTEIAGSQVTSGRVPQALRSRWFLGIIAALVIIGIGALLWHFVPSLLPSSIATVKPAVVLIQTSDGFGSGVIINKSGYVLTCNSVLKNDSQIQVTVLDSGQFVGKVIARDENKDVAIVKIDTGSFSIPMVTIGDSDKLVIGEELIAIGYSLGLKGGATVSKGIVSAIRESDQVRYIQTDAPFNPGNAGSPLINSRGEVVGIMTAKVLGVDGVTFAIAINGVKPLVAIYK